MDDCGVRIVVEGAPVGKGRPKIVRRTYSPYPVAVTPTKTVNYEAILAAAGAEAMAGRAPFDGPLHVRLVAYMPIAASWSPKKVAAALVGSFRPGKPDIDNVLKLAADALNTIVWRDDAQIAEATLSKRCDPRPRLEIEVRPIHQAQAQTVAAAWPARAECAPAQQGSLL